jgi:hypothetical protein
MDIDRKVMHAIIGVKCFSTRKFLHLAAVAAAAAVPRIARALTDFCEKSKNSCNNKHL